MGEDGIVKASVGQACVAEGRVGGTELQRAVGTDVHGIEGLPIEQGSERQSSSSHTIVTVVACVYNALADRSRCNEARRRRC